MARKEGKKEAKRDDFSKGKMDPEFFYPFSLGNQSLEESDEKEVENTVIEMREKFFGSLKVINEEILQLREFLIEDQNLAQELCKLIGPILKKLNLSFTIPAKAIPLFEKTDQIILNEDSHIIFVNEKNKIDSKALKEYPSEIILLIFVNIIPQLGKVLKLYRRKVGIRVSFFEKIYRELENANRAFLTSNQSPDKDLEESVEVNGVNIPLFSKNEDEEEKTASSGAELQVCMQRLGSFLREMEATHGDEEWFKKLSILHARTRIK